MAKSKLNSIETLISQALIDLELNHGEIKSIVNEKKESIRMMKSSNELNENNKNIKKIMKMYKIKKIIFFFFCMYKVLKIIAETYAKNCIHNMINKEKILWLRNKSKC